MAASSVSARMRLVLIAGTFAVAPLASATDFYDGVSLHVPMVDVGGTVYASVITTVGSIVSVGGGAPSGNFDSYDRATGLLFIPSVVYAPSGPPGTTYSNVTVNVAMSNVQHVGGVITSPSFLIVANPNDQTIGSYPYGVHSTSAAAVPVSVVGDPAMATADPNKEVKLYLDKPNGLLFDQVRHGNGTMTVTTFAIDVGTGSLRALPGASVTLPFPEGSLDTTSHRMLAVGQSGVTVYPYDTVTGVMQAATASSNNPIYQNVFAFDQQNALLFSSDGATLASFAFASGSAEPQPIAQVASSIDNSNTAQDVNSWFDAARKLMFVSDTATASSGTVLSGVPYSASSLGPAGNAVATVNSWFCGIDPIAKLLFLAPSNGPGNGSPSLNLFSYAGNATVNPSALPFTPTFLGSNYGACAEIDPANHVVFFLSNNPGAVNFYVYDTASGSVNITSTAAGSFSIASGAGQIGILSTQSLPQ
jgi:hypothetical protein